MDGEKLCRREGQPPSRANFCERLYEEKTDHFVRVNSACACCLCLALTVWWSFRRIGPHGVYSEKRSGHILLNGGVTNSWQNIIFYLF